jgi:hypothetical protein
MKNPKPYPIWQVAIDLYGDNEALNKQLATLTERQKELGTVAQENPQWVDFDNTDADRVTEVLIAAAWRKKDPLIVTNAMGTPVKTPNSPNEIRKTYVGVENANKELKDAGYSLAWKPKSVRKEKTNGVNAQLNTIKLIQKEATRFCLHAYALGTQPSVNNIKDQMVKWCVSNDVKTVSGIHPSANYIQKHILSKKQGWTLPPRPTKPAKTLNKLNK